MKKGKSPTGKKKTQMGGSVKALPRLRTAVVGVLPLSAFASTSSIRTIEHRSSCLFSAGSPSHHSETILTSLSASVGSRLPSAPSALPGPPHFVSSSLHAQDTQTGSCLSCSIPLSVDDSFSRFTFTFRLLKQGYTAMNELQGVFVVVVIIKYRKRKSR